MSSQRHQHAPSWRTCYVEDLAHLLEDHAPHADCVHLPALLRKHSLVCRLQAILRLVVGPLNHLLARAAA